MKKSFTFPIVLILYLLLIATSWAQSDGLSNRVFQFGQTNYIVAQDGAIGFSEALLYGSTDMLGLAGEFSEPGYFVANFMLSDDTSKFEIIIKAEDLFESPLLLNISSSDIANKHNVQPYGQRKKFAAKYPQGVSREFSCSQVLSSPELNIIVLQCLQRSDKKMQFNMIMRGVISDFYSSPSSTIIMPDTNRRSETIYDTYITPQESAMDVFSIKLNSDRSGVFYGNTDILDESREGYTPGFYAVPMKDLSIKGNDISFEIEIGVKDISGSQSYAVKSVYENAESLLKLYPNSRFKARLCGAIEQNKIIIQKANTKLYDDLIFVR